MPDDAIDPNQTHTWMLRTLFEANRCGRQPCASYNRIRERLLVSAELQSARDIITAGIHACKDEMDRAPQCPQIYDLTNLYIEYFCQCVRRDSEPLSSPHTSA